MLSSEFDFLALIWKYDFSWKKNFELLKAPIVMSCDSETGMMSWR